MIFSTLEIVEGIRHILDAILAAQRDRERRLLSLLVMLNIHPRSRT